MSRNDRLLWEEQVGTAADAVRKANFTNDPERLAARAARDEAIAGMEAARAARAAVVARHALELAVADSRFALAMAITKELSAVFENAQKAALAKHYV